MNATEGERNARIARIMWEQNVTYNQAAAVADAGVRFEERKAERRAAR